MTTDTIARGLALGTRAVAAANALRGDGLISGTSRTKMRAYSIIGSAPTLSQGTAFATSTVNTSGAYNLPTVPWTDSRLVYPGSIPTVSNTYLSLPQTVQTASGSRSPNTWSVRFVTDAAKFDFLTKNSGSWNLIVDGQILSTSASQSLTAGAPAGSFYQIVDFGSAAVRHVELVFGATAFFGGIDVPVGYSVWAWPIIGPRSLVLGDSYVQATGAGYIGGAFGFQFGRLLGFDDTWQSGVGGTGYLATNGIATFRQRLASDVVAYAPAYVAVFGGINDNAQTPSTLQAEVTTFYQQLLAALPNAKVVVFAPWRAPAKNPAQNISDAIKAGVQAVSGYGTRLFYVDTYAANYQFGTGYNGTGSNDGNAYRLIGSDGTHPNQLGHDYLAQRSAIDFAAVLGWTVP